MKNYAAAKTLIKKYESITLKEIKKVYLDEHDDMNRVANILTGIGAYRSCILCKDAGVLFRGDIDNCINCIYGIKWGCIKHPNVETYTAIMEATAPKELYIAYRNRAKHIRGILKRDGISFRTLKPI